ncbi:hypothetical protein N7499_001626 [Penicillium canescens]|uniref:Uncharacterized protein n=1 Tax=Penicillium canescens TaxID=5083 RepID=A0AAD6I7C9_PENCN|nr:uncharacterized protein N7446_009170 [Penicillium canescens]KAJ6034421.1 hypothetical protein N7460_008596 [Penicillium canescens]KAJ6046079.1 hypothetical protein N7444_007333 [Penicillium canescens]KAJ6053158.1 hypothetical protein N7446_009170 [Penicillium canescens]KAJ6097252.1 hypothetical protein N7499_001626 [Penicillium canescens]KAJ6165242.1 hypothetical protein N7485_008486 [Penicillium canescens]
MVHPYAYPTSHLKRLLLSDVSDILKCQIQILSRHFWISNLNPGGWPWGWAIYRTSYANTSDEDWARAIEKLDQACLAGLADKEGEWTWLGRTLIELVREGYGNVIFEDPTLEGVSEAVVRSRHRAWAKTYGRPAFGPCPPFHYPLLLDDRCVRSILASAEP